jgi:hypothetical protein
VLLRAQVDDAIFRQRGAADADQVFLISTMVVAIIVIPFACHLKVLCGVEERARECRAINKGHDDTFNEPLRLTLPHLVKLLDTVASTALPHATHGTRLLG